MSAENTFRRTLPGPGLPVCRTFSGSPFLVPGWRVDVGGCRICSDGRDREVWVRRSGGLGSVLPADAVPAAYVDVSLLVGMVASGEAPSSAAVADRASFASCTTYDELGRLRHAWTGAVGCTDTLTTVGSQPGGYNTSWTYTDDGNIATRRDGAATTTYDYADTAHPHAVTGASGTTYAYTAGGNQRTRTSGTTTTTLTWDVLSRLTKAVTAVGGATTNTRTYVEDVDGTRLERTDGTTTTRYVPGQEIDYTSGVVSAARRYYAIAGTTVAVRVVTPATSATVGVLTLQVSDRQGSATLQVTDRTGAVARAYTDPYGAPRPSTTALVTDRGWLQKTKDTTGLVDLGARYYDPALGRFLSPDPLNVQVTAQSANAYAYSNNNPVTFTEPTGLYAVDEDGTAYNGNHQIGQDNRRRRTPQQVDQAVSELAHEHSRQVALSHHTDDPNPGLAPVEEGIDWGNVFQKAGAVLLAGLATAGVCAETALLGCAVAGSAAQMFVTEQFNDADGKETTPQNSRGPELSAPWPHPCRCSPAKQRKPLSPVESQASPQSPVMSCWMLLELLATPRRPKLGGRRRRSRADTAVMGSRGLDAPATRSGARRMAWHVRSGVIPRTLPSPRQSGPGPASRCRSARDAREPMTSRSFRRAPCSTLQGPGGRDDGLAICNEPGVERVAYADRFGGFCAGSDRSSAVCDHRRGRSCCLLGTRQPCRRPGAALRGGGGGGARVGSPHLLVRRFAARAVYGPRPPGRVRLRRRRCF